MKKKSIQRKIIAGVASVSMLALIVMGGVGLWSTMKIQATSVQTNQTLSDSATENSIRALEAETTGKIADMANSLATLSDEKMHVIMKSAAMVAETAEKIFSADSGYTPTAISPPLVENKDQVALHYIYPNDVSQEQVLYDAQMSANAEDLMYQIVTQNASVTAAYISFESGLHVVCDASSYSRIGNKSNYDPRTRAWYRSAMEHDGMIFSDIFDDSQGRGLGISCAVPFYDDQGNPLGVVGIGSILTDINQVILDAKIGETGYAFLLNESGHMVISKDIRRGADGKIIREDYLNSKNPVLQDLAKDMVAGLSGSTALNLGGNDVYVAYAPMKTTGWSIAVVIEVEEALGPSYELKAQIDELTTQSEAQIRTMLNYNIIVVVAVLVGAALLILFIGSKIGKSLTKPILSLTAMVSEMSDGKLKKIDIKTGDEVEILGDSFNRMTTELENYIENLQLVTAEKERIGAELDVAKHIQASMLPCIFPAFPGRPEFDIYATMTPAKEVGGDFYDFFLVDDNHLALVMADVSGKGVPAALFMVIAKTLLKNCAQTGLSPKEILEKVNNQLCESNEAELFVTVWLGILDIPTGKLIAANAGHEYPVLKKAGGDYELILDKHGFVLAGMEDSRYREYELQLSPGDKFFLYTDGVPEATDAQDVLYGTDRMLDVLNRNKDASCDELLHQVKADIDAFVGAAPQFDDITMLGLEMRGEAK